MSLDSLILKLLKVELMFLDLHSKKEKYWYIFWEELLLEKLQQLDFYRNYTLNTNLL